MQTGQFLGIFKGKRVWALPDGRIEVMGKDRPLVFPKEHLRQDFVNWLKRRGQ